MYTIFSKASYAWSSILITHVCSLPEFKNSRIKYLLTELNILCCITLGHIMAIVKKGVLCQFFRNVKWTDCENSEILVFILMRFWR